MPQNQMIQGDCLVEMPLLAAGQIELILTDLPYGTTQNKWDSVLPLHDLWVQWRRLLRPGAPVVLFTQQPFTTTVAASNLAHLKTEWIWEKESGTGHLNARKYPMKSHENILVFCDSCPPYHPQKTAGKPYTTKWGTKTSSNYGVQVPGTSVNTGERYPTTVLQFPRDKGTGHPTAKPVALLEYLIRTYTVPGATVLDCTMGSGSTGVAAMRTGRNFIGIELDSNYYKIAQRRTDAEQAVLAKAA